MKKFAALLLALLLVLPAMALGEDEAWFTYSGLITEFDGEHLTVLTPGGETRDFLLTAATDVQADTALVPGAFVTLVWLHETEAPETPDVLTCFALQGTVTLTEAADAFQLTAADGRPYLVHCTEAELAGRYDGEQITVYYGGQQSRSIPAQVTAQYIRGCELTGIIAGVTEDGFLLTIGEENVIVHVTEDTLLLVPIEAGAAVSVAIAEPMLLSLPAQYFAVEVLPFYGLMPVA